MARPPRQVNLQGVKVFAQCSMPSHLQFGSGQRIRPIWKNVDCTPSFQCCCLYPCSSAVMYIHCNLRFKLNRCSVKNSCSFIVFYCIILSIFD